MPIPMLFVTLAAMSPVGEYPTVSMPRLPRAVASFGAAVHGGELFVLGGHVGRTHQHSRENLSADFLALDLVTGESRRLPGGAALQGLALVAHESGLVCVGGLSARNAPEEPEDLWSVGTVARFELDQERWSELPPLPEPRSSHDAVLAGDLLVVAGGWTLAGEDKGWRETALILDLERIERGWRTLEQPFRRRALALAGDGERVFCVGGLDELGLTSSEVDVLELASGTWSSAPALPGSGFGSSAWWHAGALHVVLADGRLLRLDEHAGRPAAWRKLGTLAFPRMFPRLVPGIDGELLVVGGAQKEGHVPWIERLALEPETGDLRAQIATFELEHPGNAKQRAGFLARGGYVWLLGGNRHREAHRFAPDDFLAECFRLHLASASSERLPDLPAPRQSMAILPAPDGASAWVMGGFGNAGEGERSFDDLWSLSLADGRTRVLDARLPRPLTQFGSALIDGHPWIFGGLDFDSLRIEPFEHQDAVAALEAGAISDTERVLATRLPGERRAFAGVVHENAYYVVGGLRDGFEPVEDCLRLELSTGRWSEIPAPRAPRVSAELVPLGGKLYLVGGSAPKPEGGLRPEPSIEVFEPESGRWSVLLEEHPLPPSNLHVAAWGERLLLMSAIEGEGLLRVALVKPDDGRVARAQ